MNIKKCLFRLILVILGLNLTAPLIKCQNTTPDVLTLKVENVSASVTNWFGLFDKVIIVSASGISWLRISADPPFNNRAWETTTNVLYDGVPIIGSTMICPKILAPTLSSGPIWRLVTNVSVAAWGKGSVTLRRIPLAPDPPYTAEGEYLDKGEPVIDGLRQDDGMITLSPQYLQPGNTTNIQVTIPWRMRRHITGVVLKIPVPPSPNINTITLPFDPDGIYDYAWTVPTEPYGDNQFTGGAHDVSIKYEAYSNKPNENGQSYLITAGIGYFNITQVLAIQMQLQDKIVLSGSTNIWDNFKPRSVTATWTIKGRGPYKVRWIVNGQEIPTLYNELPVRQMSKLEDQNALTNAASVTCEVTDANGNKASGTIYVGVQTDISFQFNVQGVKVENGSTVNWREEASKIVTINPIHNGKTPFLSKWLINEVEAAIHKLESNRFDQLEDQDILNKAKSITLELTDANGVLVKGTIFIGNPGSKQDTVKTPAGPTGPAPITPPLTGNPGVEPNPDIPWNNKPWMDSRVQACTREYLQKIVLYMENEIRKWENTGLAESKKNALFTSIDEWGRLLNQYITASGGVDGNWDNPTHYVWSAYNKPSATIRYGRTVEYYVKYECNSSRSSPDDINNAIKVLTDDEAASKWDNQKIKNAQSSLNALLDLARSLYSQFNVNYNKFVNEINDRNSNPLQNEIIALCLANAQRQFNDHSVNKDTINSTGNSLIAQASSNKDIDMFAIIRILSEVQDQFDDMNKKLGEMKNLLTVMGADIKDIITNGERLIAQGNVNPEFAQDGGVNVEFFGDGIDNFGDGLQDFLYGNQRRGNVLIIVWDSGNIADDIFEVSISGKGSLGNTPVGGRRNFDVTLSPGIYTITIRGVYTNPNTPPCTFGIQVYNQNNLILETNNLINVNQETVYSITIK